VLVRDNLNTHVSAAMRDPIAARDWLHVQPQDLVAAARSSAAALIGTALPIPVTMDLEIAGVASFSVSAK